MRFNQKITYFVVVLLSLSACQNSPNNSIQGGSQDIKTFSPPITRIELSGKEPLPAGIDENVDFSGGAGGGGEDDSQSPKWLYTPENPSSPSNSMNHGSGFIGCGYTNNVSPEGLITYPSGKQENVLLERAESIIGYCWSYQLPVRYGMQLGNYTMTFSHSMGNLTYSWSISLPNQTHFTDIFDSSGNTPSDSRMYAFMGFKPGQTIKVTFYGLDVDRLGTFFASREITMDSNGTAVIQYSTTRSTPYGLDDIDITYSE
jgi:hypothetical protein